MSAREILFRGKRMDDGEWIEGYYAKFDQLSSSCIYYVYKGHTLVADIEPETICWYTGLTDKNGRKIFEGDILEFTDCELGKENYTVFWNQVEWGIRSELGNIDDLRDWDSSNWEVIGNIFDNPELLN